MAQVSAMEEISKNFSSNIKAKSETSIDDLNYDCLISILSYLTPCELIKIERVCKKWRDLSWNIWARRKSFKLIKLQDFDGLFKCKPDYFEQIFKRCGDSLSYLILNKWDLPIKPIIPLIKKYCPNLSHLEIACHDLDDNNLELLSTCAFAEKLEWLQLFGEEDHEVSNGLSTLLEKAVNLNAFHLGLNCGEGESLLNLSTKCRILKISKLESFIDNNIYKQALERLPNLEVLIIFEENSSILPDSIVSVSNQLIKLKLDNLLDFFKDGGYKNLNFQNLRSLAITHCEVTDEHVTHFVKNCPILEKINLSGCRNISENGLRVLANLKNLVKLNVGLTQISDTCLEYLAAKSGRYKKISIHGCKNISEECVIRVIGCLPKLEMLIFKLLPDQLYGNKTFFKKALETVLLRTNNITLCVHTYSFDSGYENNEEIKRLGLTKCHNVPLKTNRLKIVGFGSYSLFVSSETVLSSSS